MDWRPCLTFNGNCFWLENWEESFRLITTGMAILVYPEKTWSQTIRLILVSQVSELGRILGFSDNKNICNGKEVKVPPKLILILLGCPSLKKNLGISE